MSQSRFDQIMTVAGSAEQARQSGFTDSVLAVLWAKANLGPEEGAISHATALNVYGISDGNMAGARIDSIRRAILEAQSARSIFRERATHAFPPEPSRDE